jgi:hypothetical protein
MPEIFVSFLFKRCARYLWSRSINSPVRVRKGGSEGHVHSHRHQIRGIVSGLRWDIDRQLFIADRTCFRLPLPTIPGAYWE